EVLQVTATDEAGNESELVEVVIEDKTPPTAPTVNQVTSEDTEIRGTAEPGSTVKVTLPSGPRADNRSRRRRKLYCRFTG
ncbi:Ig-like domain-containing protein, partial [Staphylococcus succinus]|uniref:Ig-like domain-containing protein n=1 Tax=Staphylococcus succinus TaxID=61015 RepID=UPI001F22D2D9